MGELILMLLLFAVWGVVLWLDQKCNKYDGYFTR